MKPVIAVLAGGSSSRMGADKALVTIGEETMLDRVATVAATVGDVVVVGGAQQTISDLRPDRLGPMAGLEAALLHASGHDVVLLGVDQPFVRAETLRHLIELSGDVVVPVDNEWEQVTCAVYRAPFLPVVQAALDGGADLAIHHHLDRVATTRVHHDQWSAWGEDGRSWFSIDTPEALASGLDRYS